MAPRAPRSKAPELWSRIPEAVDEDTLAAAREWDPADFGKYAMINRINGACVVAPTASEAHKKFIETFGPEAEGLCMRIGASPFAGA